eukprot:Nitzschia sp. Nitz4//scaffold31_size150131//131102//132751//NITZ4_002852-RA/size150131-processed-gene-0.210-mRNA-1//1//CDS//3329547731//1175//frame0
MIAPSFLYMKFLITTVLLLWSSVKAMLPQTMDDDIGDKSLASLSSSPECWLDAVRALNLDTMSNSDTCSWMSSHQQKMLALELARCHVQELGRSIFQESSPDCSLHSYQANFYDCLTQLTPTGETSYTHFLTYINQLCTRLLREVVMTNYYETSMQLARTSAQAQQQLQYMVEQQSQLWESWKYREEETSRLHESFKREVFEERIRWVQESSMIKSQIRAQGAEWLEEAQAARTAQLAEMEFQRQEIIQQREELKRLSETVVLTQQSIMPWSLSLDQLYTYLQHGYRVLDWFVRALSGFVLIWFLCIPPCLRWLKPYMMGWILLAGLMECLVAMGNDGWLTEEDETAFIRSVRDLLLMTEVATFVFGTLASCVSCCCGRSPKGSSESESRPPTRPPSPYGVSPGQQRAPVVLVDPVHTMTVQHEQSQAQTAASPTVIQRMSPEPMLSPPKVSFVDDQETTANSTMVTNGSVLVNHHLVTPNAQMMQLRENLSTNRSTTPVIAKDRHIDDSTSKRKRSRVEEMEEAEFIDAVTEPSPKRGRNDEESMDEE